MLTGLGLLGLIVVHPNVPLAAATPQAPPGAPVAEPVTPATIKLAIAPQVAGKQLIPPAAPSVHGALPVGKGMWIWQPEKADGANPQAIIARAQRIGLTHIYLRTGSSKVGFQAAGFLDALLPVAHAAGIRVYGWDFPYLDDIGLDAARAAQAARYVTPTGDRIDGFAADIEFRSMGVNITPETATTYGNGLRQAVGPGFPLIAVVPRPTPAVLYYPYTQVAAQFDAIAPMIYWLNNDPAQAVQMTFDRLAPLGKPILPVGQAYDGFAEGGPPGVPNRGSIHAFMSAVADHGGAGVSFWSWQHATDEAWQAIHDAALFQLPAGDVKGFRPDQVRVYQVLLTSLGFAVPMTSVWDSATDAAVRAYQSAARLPVNGGIDDVTRTFLLTPVAPPVNRT